MTAMSPLFAHTGLPTGGLLDGLTHPVVGLDHLLAMVAVGLGAALVPTRRWVAPAGFVGGMLAGGLVGLSGVGLPGVEVTIALSVVLLGAIVAIAPHARTPRLAAGLGVLAALFGVAHGHAHGAELPATARPALYVVGFLAATIALHAAGALVGSTIGTRRRAHLALGGGVGLAGIALLLGIVTA